MNKLKNWLIPIGLIVLVILPIIAGLVRLLNLSQGGPVNEENERFFSEPLAVWVHILASSIFGLLGAVQFSPGFRSHHMVWHRTAGKFLVVAAGFSAISGLYLTIVFPKLETDGPTLLYIRLVVGTLMTMSLVLAVRAILTHDFKTHGQWMTRCYAIGMGAGTQVLTHLP